MHESTFMGDAIKKLQTQNRAKNPISARAWRAPQITRTKKLQTKTIFTGPQEANRKMATRRRLPLGDINVT